MIFDTCENIISFVDSLSLIIIIIIIIIMIITNSFRENRYYYTTDRLDTATCTHTLLSTDVHIRTDHVRYTLRYLHCFSVVSCPHPSDSALNGIAYSPVPLKHPNKSPPSLSSSSSSSSSVDQPPIRTLGNDSIGLYPFSCAMYLIVSNSSFLPYWLIGMLSSLCTIARNAACYRNILRNGNINIGDLSFEEVEKFKYLGATITNINDTREEIKRTINMGNACYYSVEKLLPSSLLSKYLKVRIYKTVMLPVVLCGCEN
ncbi:hypothetical protein ANN_04116 [Periplaneta americana]|uniref:Uncharacterized protein n=1 Tax=Periplaneta americana TaxID=6978 RepID=A0ABQ8T7P2_PERAM|nr:hypothetical protein ANN_04116 [Periplaneta americana]